MKSLEFAPGVWSGLLADLGARGCGRWESGAFLLGIISDQTKYVQTWVAYEDLDSTALAYDYVHLSSAAFPRLWMLCSEMSLQVVGDVHTHPRGPSQSQSDKDNPMISIVGHLALIVPKFAMGDIDPIDVSVNIYLGDKRWRNLQGKAAAAFIKIQG